MKRDRTSRSLCERDVKVILTMKTKRDLVSTRISYVLYEPDALSAGVRRQDQDANQNQTLNDDDHDSDHDDGDYSQPNSVDDLFEIFTRRRINGPGDWAFVLAIVDNQAVIIHGHSVKGIERVVCHCYENTNATLKRQNTIWCQPESAMFCAHLSHFGYGVHLLPERGFSNRAGDEGMPKPLLVLTLLKIIS